MWTPPVTPGLGRIPEIDPVAAQKELLGIAHTACTEIGRVLAGGDLDIVEKSEPTDLQSRADRRSQEVISDLVARAFPGVPMVGEEDPGAAQEKFRSPYVVVFDPLDGTYNFLNGGKEWAVIIGLFRQGVPVAGVVVQPLVPHVFVSSSGSEALLDGGSVRPIAEPKTLAVSVGGRVPKFYTERMYPEFERQGYRILPAACAAAAQMAVIDGSAGAYLALGEKLWDVAGAMPYFHHQGAVRPILPAQIRYDQLDMPPFVAGQRPELVEPVARILADLGFRRELLYP